MVRSLARNPFALYAASLGLVLVAAVVVAVTNPQPEGACSGIGWGCSLYGWDAAVFGLLLVGLPFAFVAGVVLLVTWLLPERVRAVSVVAGWIAVALPVYVIVATVLS